MQMGKMHYPSYKITIKERQKEMLQVIATGPRNECIKFQISKESMKEMLRDSLYAGTRSSQAIENEPLEEFEPPAIESIPEEMLTTT